MKEKIQKRIRLHLWCAVFDILVISTALYVHFAYGWLHWSWLLWTIVGTWFLYGDLYGAYRGRKILRDPLFYLIALREAFAPLAEGDRVQTGPVTVIKGDCE